MRRSLSLVLLGLPLALAIGCGGGGDSSAALTPSGTVTSANVALFDPANSIVPLPNVLATATASDPLAGRAANTPMTPPEALAYVNLHEMGSTNAVSGVNAPIYIRFAAAVDATTISPATVKVFQITPDSTGTENNPLGFTDVSGMFTYQYTAGGTDLFLFPNFPLLPATRYLYVVTEQVKDAATGAPVTSSPYFEALKSTAPLTGAVAALEPIRANVLLNPAQPQGATNPILFSGYGKVMDDLIAASAKTGIATRSNIALMGRFITTGAGFISATTPSPSATGAVVMPMESALRAFALGKMPTGYPQGLPGKTWTNAATVATTFDRGGVNPSPDAYYAAVLGTGATAPASVGTIALGTINSADLSVDPVLVSANATSIDLTGVVDAKGNPAYNPAAGVVQAYRPDGKSLAGFYYSNRTIPFIYIAPAGVAPVGGWPLVIFQHGITAQKENVLGVAQTLTTIGYAVVAIDLPLHGANALPGLTGNSSDKITYQGIQTTKGAVWGQTFMAIGAPLAARSNLQQAIVNLDRLEFTVRFGGFASLGGAMPSMTNLSYVGHSLGSIVGAYYLAGNTTLDTTPGNPPYTQASLNHDMRGYLSVPGARISYLIQNSPAFGPGVDAGLAAVGVVKNTPTYHQFFLLTQAIIDPADPATITTPLAAGLPSRLSNRICIQESVGDQVISNPYTRYLGNALGGREVLGSAGAAVAPGFKQLAYTAGGTPNHAAGVSAQFMYTLGTSGLAPKVDNAAVIATATSPTEGYFQFDQTGIGHSSLLDPSNMTNLLLIQKQMRYFLGMPGLAPIVVDPTQGGAVLPIRVVPALETQTMKQYSILGH